MDEGLDKLDAIAMMLIAIGENIKRVDRMTNGGLLSACADFDWKGAMGARDFIGHQYFDTDAEVVFGIC